LVEQKLSSIDPQSHWLTHHMLLAGWDGM